MLYKLFIMTMLISSQTWGLSCSAPTTITNMKFSCCHLDIRGSDNGNVAVIWTAKDDDNRAVAISYKRANSRWSPQKIISDWYCQIEEINFFINNSAELYAGWVVKDDNKNYVQHIAKQTLDESWNLFSTTPSLSNDFNLNNTYFDSDGKFVLMGYETHSCSFSPKSRSFEGNTEFTTMTTSLIQNSQNNDIFQLTSNFCRISHMQFVVNKNNNGYLIWVDTSLLEDRIMVRKMQNGQFISEAEQIYLSNNCIYDLKASINENADFAIIFSDNNNDVRVIASIEGSLTEPCTVNECSESTSELDTSIDDLGNILAVVKCKFGDAIYLKSLYKGYNRNWLATAFPLPPEATELELKPDGSGYFVLFWQVETLQNKKRRYKHCAIFGTSFSTEDSCWTLPEQLSPKKLSCFGYTTHYFAPGKGVISWFACKDGLKPVIQVAELSD